MEQDNYQIEVLHFVNPHLIWIEVVPVKDGVFKFEQVGVYGVMPMEVTIDMAEGCVKGQESLDWTPAVAQIMGQIFSGAKEIWFRPVFIDRSPSIFDSNVHKYGEFTIITKDGTSKDLSVLLSKSCFAYNDHKAFLNALASCNLKTKLNATEKKAVVEILKHYNPEKKNYENSLKKHTTVTNAAVKLENALTESNLDKHNRMQNDIIKDKKVDDIMIQKYKDFELCKDDDEVSFGRGVPLRHAKKIKANVRGPMEDLKNLLLQLATPRSLDRDTLKIETEDQIEEVDRPVMESPVFERPTQNRFTKGLVNVRLPSERLPTERSTTERSTTERSTTERSTTERLPNVRPPTEDPFIERRLPERPVFEREMSEEPPSSVSEPPKQMFFKKNPKKKGPKIIVPEYDMEKEVRIAIGPPDVDIKLLPPKVIPKTDEFLGYGEEDKKFDPAVIQRKDPKIVTPDVKFLSTKVIPNTDEFLGYPEGEKKFDAAQSQRKGLDSFKENFDIKTDSNICHKLAKKLKLLADVKKYSKPNTSVCSTDSKKSDSNELNSKFNSTSMSSISTESESRIPNSIMKRCRLFKELSDRSTETTVKDSSNDSDNETTLSNIVERIVIEKDIPTTVIPKTETIVTESHVNPFKNTDPSISKFVDKLVSPVLMVHTRSEKRIQPVYDIREVNFNTHIHSVLSRNGVKHPMTLQTVSWFSILRGYSIIMISPLNSGKTVGYIPAVCRLVTDFNEKEFQDSLGPVCIVVCGTTKSVIDVEKQCRKYLSEGKTVISSYAGLDEMETITALLNGCHVLVCTPSALVRLLRRTDFGVDLRRLTTFVLDDCERLNEVYLNEVKFFQLKIKEMLKNRANKELKVQFILASRIWCDFMEPLAKNTPNTLVCIGSFQECVLYSKSNMSINFVDQKKKIDLVKEFLDSVDKSKKTVIVCRTDEEVAFVRDALKKHNMSVFAADNNMTVEDLYSLSTSWNDYEEPLKGPILVCCDGNLTHLNIINAHNLLHYSLPNLFSMFAKRFAVLTDHYPSIFRSDNNVVKIKILLESDNVEQLPKILNFIRRCEPNLPDALNEVCAKVLKERDLCKAKNLVPLCDNMLGLGECPDYWNCKERHSVIQEFDEPEEWIPKTGYVTFKILHYHTPVKYSARLIANIVNGKVTKYPRTHSTLTLKMNLYYSKSNNRKLHGIPKVGDICAVSLNENFFERCQVVKILKTDEKTGQPSLVLVKLIDEEKWEMSRDVFLYHLPEDLKNENSHVALVRLVTIQPQDRDVTYSDLAIHELRNLTEKHEDLYVRARIVTTIGNFIIVDTLETCQDLTSSKETVVRYNLKEVLLNKHAKENLDHLVKLEKLAPNMVRPVVLEKADSPKPVVQVKPRWAFFHSEDFQLVYVSSAMSPDSFFVRLEKFDDCLEQLEKDIQKHVTTEPDTYQDPKVGDLVLAKFASTSLFYRARIDQLGDTIKCFFVDHGDWDDVGKSDMYPLPEKFISVMPFQAIECRLIGLTSPSESWSEYSTNWFTDHCVEGIDLKKIYAKYFTKEMAIFTEGRKYGVIVIDTTGDTDVVLNKAMIELNLAKSVEDEVSYFDDLNFEREVAEDSDKSDWEAEYERFKEKKALMPVQNQNNTQKSLFDHGKLIRSVPLANSDDEFDDAKWDVEMDYEDLTGVKPQKNILEAKELPAIEPKKLEETSPSPASSKLDFEVIPRQKIIELDSDDLSSAESTPSKILEVKELHTVRRPKLTWRQKSNNISIRIELIGVEKYELKMESRRLHFKATIHDTDYEFEFKLYGLIDTEQSFHEPRGLYIFVKLTKVLKKNWLSLTSEGGLKKWIVYDPDSIEASSSEEEEDEVERVKKEIVRRHEDDSESDADDFYDDSFRP